MKSHFMPVFIICIATFTLNAFGQQAGCPYDPENALAEGQDCTAARECASTSDICQGRRECVCDGYCGLRCIKVRRENYCGELATPDNASPMYDSSRHYAFNTTVTYNCTNGSVLLSGDLTRKCRGDSKWSGQEPHCVHPDEYCPKKMGAIGNSNRTCLTSCTIQGNECGSNETCVCDDMCGMSCVQTALDHYCDDLPDVDYVETTYNSDSRIFGTVATSDCVPGYRASSGTKERTCGGDGRWSGEGLVCQSFVTCPINPYPEVENAQVEGLQEYYLPGQHMYYSCNYGHYRLGLRYIRCNEDGTWSEPEMTCRLKSCPTPNVPENGGRIGNIFTFGNTVTLTCNIGYEMRGWPYKTCQGDQTWSGYDVECRPVECPKLYPPTNGNMHPEEVYTYQTRVEITCDEGFTPASGNVRECQANGEWSGQQFACRAIDCGDPGTPANGAKDGTSYGLNDVVYFTCNNGFELQGRSVLRCTASEEWSAETPQCRGFCTLPNAPANSRYVNNRAGNRLEDGESATIQCYSGHTLTPNEPWTCDNGHAANDIQCIETPCTVLQQTSSTSFTYDPAIQQDSLLVASRTNAVISCSHGYRLRQSARDTMLCKRGQWIDMVSNPCEPEPCVILGELENGKVTYNIFVHQNAQSVGHGTIATYVCNGGYQLTGSSARTECRTGQWTNMQQPVCVPEPCVIQDISDGTISYDPPLPVTAVTIPSGTWATHVCHSGYQLEVAHSGRQQCNQGTWSSQVPSCIPEPCLLLEVDEANDFEVQYNPTFFLAQIFAKSGTIATYQCKQGYHGTAASTTCRQGNWDIVETPVCSPAPCPKFSADNTVTYSPASSNLNVPHLTVARFSACEYGFRLSSSYREMVCSYGVWQGNETCIPMPCPNDIVDSASVIYRKIGDSEAIDTTQPHHGMEREFSCDAGFNLLGRTTSECRAGRWLDVQPVCTSNPCSPIIQDSHVRIITYDRANLTDGSYSTGSMATITCWDNFYVQDQRNTAKCLDGAWNPSIPLCKSENLALRKDTIQSSTAGWRSADRAVDGVRASTSGSNSCTHTVNSEEPWWQVDLGHFYSITNVNVVIYNDADTCPNCRFRIEGAVVRVSKTWNPDELSSYTQCGSPVTRQQARAGIPIEFNCEAQTVARYVSVQLVGKTERLQLCEVEVYGSGPVEGCVVPSILNGYVNNYRPNAFVETGTQIIYGCNDRYHLQRDRDNMCLSIGQWYYADHPSCEPDGCSLSGDPYYGTLYTQSPAPHDTIIAYSCDNGYEKSTSEDIKCKYGQLKPQDYMRACVLASCTVPQLAEHVQVVNNVFSPNDIVPHGQAVSFKCEAGYRLDANGYNTCYQGRWYYGDVSTWRCNPLPCPQPSSVAHGRYEFVRERGFWEGAVIQYTCDDGYKVNGEALSQCTDGSWSFAPPTCMVESANRRCYVPQVDDGNVYLYSTSNRQLLYQGTSLPHMAMVNLYCDDNRIFSSRCEDGDWSVSLQQSCIKTTCTRPGRSSTAVFQYINDTIELQEDNRREYPIGTFIISRCQDPGKWKFTPAASIRRECTTSGWTGQQPRCDPVAAEILLRGRKFNQVYNNGTIVLQAHHGPAKILCKVRSNSYPSLTAPHITRIQPRRGHYGKTRESYEMYNLGAPQPRDSGVFTCSHDRKEISVNIQVRDVRCEDPSHFNGVVTGTDFRLTRVVTFSCPAGTLEGQSSLTCNHDGWSAEIPTCLSNECQDFDIPTNARKLAGSGLHVGAVRILQCSEGFGFDSEADGQSLTVTCMDNGQWSPEVPSCTVSAAQEEATPSPDPCDSLHCELWETCAVVSNEAQCYCVKPSECPAAESQDEMVCGSDNREYETYCHMKATACYFGRSITRKNNGPCPEETDYSSEFSLYSFTSLDGEVIGEDEEVIGEVTNEPTTVSNKP
ncbi:sushi, von Willebrand factor type A, EGF and pentraxin domain-containing protein 1-like [Amphiura filiformis]|uniref:sushi, von Willebrand factor type A, EGF and pentraxin domain-containing protein 1-like n=1 Tax=Amphiura filiformis TaxID=82378 RepID=UPI003B210E8F